MMTYLVIGLCIFLLIIVIYISAKPISMGIEARRNIKDDPQDNSENNQNIPDYHDDENLDKDTISNEILKLNELKNKGVLTEEEYKKAKDKILN